MSLNLDDTQAEKKRDDDEGEWTVVDKKARKAKPESGKEQKKAKEQELHSYLDEF